MAAAWVVGDATYGGDAALRRWLEGRRQAYLLAVPGGEELWLLSGDTPAPVRADAVAAALEPRRWQWPRAGAGAAHEWAQVALATDEAGRGQPASFLGCGPAATTLEGLIDVAGQQAALDDCVAAATAELGLEDYEVRHWRGWYRHITLALLAHAYRTVSGLPATRRVAGHPGAAVRTGAVAPPRPARDRAPSCASADALGAAEALGRPARSAVSSLGRASIG